MPNKGHTHMIQIINASHLRQEHLQERARLAAKTSNVTAKVALNNILKAEAASATFRKLKNSMQRENTTQHSKEWRFPSWTQTHNPQASTHLSQTPLSLSQVLQTRIYSTSARQWTLLGSQVALATSFHLSHEMSIQHQSIRAPLTYQI